MIQATAFIWVTLLLLVQPIAAWRGRHRIASQERPRLHIYRGSAQGIATIGLVTLVLDLVSGRHALTPVGMRAFSGREAFWIASTLGGIAALWLAIQLARRVGHRPPARGFLRRATGRRRGDARRALVRPAERDRDAARHRDRSPSSKTAGV